MSQPRYGRDMDGPAVGGSARRAGDGVQAGASRNNNYASPIQPQGTRDQGPNMSPNTSPRRQAGASSPSQSRIPRLQGQASQGRDAGAAGLISRPTPIPQWPLPGPIPSPVTSSGSAPYKPPPGRSQPPQRPPRPSQVPSILDSSRVQDHTPVFQYNARDSTQSQDLSGSVPPTPSSRQTQSTISSVGSIPDFPMPDSTSQTPGLAPPRRSVGLGPPPSSRRGDSSFYSNASFVSPIPEESPRSRSHGSYASSAAIPESWGTESPEPSPAYQDRFFEDPITEEESFRSQDDDGDESKLVRSASIGKRGKPAIVMNRGVGGESFMPAEPSPAALRPAPTPVQGPGYPFQTGTGFLDVSSSSSGALPTVKATASPPPLTADAMLGAFAAASAADPADIRRATPSPRPFSRLSAIRRPPKLGLDIDSVREMEARGSMTSLPDLIKRATRLAAMMDRGNRPASRFDDHGSWPDEKSMEKEMSDDQHRSGFSDMLAAFPPPAATPAPTRQSRGSWFRRSTSSWPLAPDRIQTPPQAQPRGMTEIMYADGDSSEDKKKRRRCCGLPLWAFILLLVLLLGIVAAAIVVPLHFFVFNNKGGNNAAPEPALTSCEAQLTCENGGTNVVARDVCSCICTNGFTGSTCAVAGATGCTTTNLVLMAAEGNIGNVTLGQAIPRLIQQAQNNFTIPLMGTTILAKFNQESLSCIAQNSLVTFDGRSTRTGGANSEVVIDNDNGIDNSGGTDQPAAFEQIPFLTIAPPYRVTTVVTGTVTVTTTITAFPQNPPSTITPAPVTPTAPTTTSSIPSPTATFMVTEEVLDFARAVVLFVLQERDLQVATASQTSLQRFFAQASSGSQNTRDGVTQQMAASLSLADGITVDLVHFLVDISSSGTSGGSKRRWVAEEAIGQLGLAHIPTTTASRG